MGRLLCKDAYEDVFLVPGNGLAVEATTLASGNKWTNNGLGTLPAKKGTERVGILIQWEFEGDPLISFSRQPRHKFVILTASVFHSKASQEYISHFCNFERQMRQSLILTGSVLGIVDHHLPQWLQ